MEGILDISVFGAGVFAGYHAAKVAAHPRARLAAIYDPDADRARALAARYGTMATPRAEEAIRISDAVICAVPASYHKTVAVPALAAGKHVLIEKPLAATQAGAEAIAAAARHARTVVQVGHQERIVAELIGLHRIGERPREVRITRHCGRVSRNLDVSVVMDLMIHDLDLLLALYGEPDWVATEAAQSRYSKALDSVRAEIGFRDFTAYVSASRDAEPDRRWTLRFEPGTVDVDFAAKTLRHDTPYGVNQSFGLHPDAQDSLGAAFDRFVRACLDGDPPLASVQDGLDAVRLAQRIEDDA